MLTTIETWDRTAMLTPAKEPESARQDSCVFGPNLTILKGEFIGIKTSDKKGYSYAHGNADGTQIPKGIAMYSFKTDAAGLVYFVTGADTAVPSVRQGPWSTAPIWKTGIFDPNELKVANLVAEVDTFTPATIEVGDLFTLTLTRPNGTTKAITFVATATTAANVSAGVIALWNADPELAAIATASGSATVVLTAVTPGVAFSVASTAVNGGAADTQTFTRAATTAPSGRSMTDILTDWAGSKIQHDGFLKLP